MKTILKKIFKTFIIFLTSTIIIYLIFTLSAFYNWCHKNQISIVNHSDDLLTYLDSNKIQELGERINLSYETMKDSLDTSYYEENSNYHSLAEYYDPLGFCVWSYMQEEISWILNKYLVISILSSISITIAYLVITSKIKPILKFIIGYLGVMLVIPPIYLYSWTYRFWDILQTYRSTPIYFYIGYTIIFILMYTINYRIGIKMARELNQTIEKTLP